MAESTRTRGSVVEQLVWCEKRTEELEDQVENLLRFRDEMQNCVDSWDPDWSAETPIRQVGKALRVLDAALQSL